jgi:hypothetical protein
MSAIRRKGEFFATFTLFKALACTEMPCLFGLIAGRSLKPQADA